MTVSFGPRIRYTGSVLRNSYKLVIVWSPLDGHFCEWKLKVSGKGSIEKEKRVKSRVRSRE